MGWFRYDSLSVKYVLQQVAVGAFAAINALLPRCKTSAPPCRSRLRFGHDGEGEMRR